MRSATTRLIIVIASLLIAIIMGMQVHWLNKTYNFEKNEFNTSVLKAVRGVYEDLPLLYNSQVPLDSLVEKYNENTFLFQVDSLPSGDTLLSHLSSELEDFHVFTDYKVAMYDARANKYLFEQYVSADATDKSEDRSLNLPLIKRPFSYVHIFFPNRNNYIVSEMRSWIYASAVLLLLLVGFSFSIYYFLKQKFMVDIQRDFINNVTHEFSTPLSVIELSVEALEKPSVVSNGEKHNKYVRSIKYQSDYLKNHISNLINTVVAGHYYMSFQKKPVVPNELLKRVVLQLEPLLLKKEGVVEWQLEENQSTIMADEENLYLAFFNIINNAIKYSAVPKVLISTVKDDNHYQVSIKDNGIGMEPSQQKKIFKKFYRAQNGNIHSVKGLGLGLYFTKKVIDGHHGHISVNSILGIGTEFKIDLPVNSQ